ncbi:unnamed protein product [Fraxinus pennsylvanica]|uniref:Uncharacterized protein n=1 Tax=Fraxinus pennsylvanica TaxID=56036 RepID=A0AAD2ABX6_9LAMI|nr:unnamed protein product [Fraxinus pennsylvanica]
MKYSPTPSTFFSRTSSFSFSVTVSFRCVKNKMNHCTIQKNTFAACDEMKGKKGAVVCPKPRRVGLVHAAAAFNDSPSTRPLRWHSIHQLEACDAKAGNELLEIILAKGSFGADQSVAQVASSPPFFSGSPPRRVSNPLIQDARFGDEKVTPVSPRAIPIPSGLGPSPSSTRKVGRVRANFGNSPAVRIEGFDCLDRDRRNCSIPALA